MTRSRVQNSLNRFLFLTDFTLRDHSLDSEEDREPNKKNKLLLLFRDVRTVLPPPGTTESASHSCTERKTQEQVLTTSVFGERLSAVTETQVSSELSSARIFHHRPWDTPSESCSTQTSRSETSINN